MPIDIKDLAMVTYLYVTKDSKRFADLDPASEEAGIIAMQAQIERDALSAQHAQPMSVFMKTEKPSELLERIRQLLMVQYEKNPQLLQEWKHDQTMMANRMKFARDVLGRA